MVDIPVLVIERRNIDPLMELCKFPDRDCFFSPCFVNPLDARAGIPAARYINATARSRYTGDTVINATG